MIVLLVALLVARSCGSNATKVSQDQAIAIAKQQVDYTPNHVMIRIMKQGFKSKPFWAVSLSQQAADGTLHHVTVVVVDATTGAVQQVRRS